MVSSNHPGSYIHEWRQLALDDALTGDSELTGTFAFSRTYSDAPNPVLDVAGLGTIGLPLSVRDADAIKAQSSQAPFGMADRTVVDKTVRDTWEIDAHQVCHSDLSCEGERR